MSLSYINRSGSLAASVAAIATKPLGHWNDLSITLPDPKTRHQDIAITLPSDVLLSDRPCYVHITACAAGRAALHSLPEQAPIGSCRHRQWRLCWIPSRTLRPEPRPATM